MSENPSAIFISALRDMLPRIFARHTLTDITGGLINSRTIANKQSKGEGPPAVKFKGRVGFERESFLHWLEQSIEEFAVSKKNNTKKKEVALRPAPEIF